MEFDNIITKYTAAKRRINELMATDDRYGEEMKYKREYVDGIDQALGNFDFVLLRDHTGNYAVERCSEIYPGIQIHQDFIFRFTQKHSELGSDYSKSKSVSYWFNGVNLVLSSLGYNVAWDNNKFIIKKS